jgi:hypothetical protein
MAVTSCNKTAKPDKALHPIAIPVRFIAAGELGRCVVTTDIARY